MAIKRINQTDQINTSFQNSDDNFQEISTTVTNITTGHDHDGTDSKAIDHTNLLNKGTKTHATIDSDIGTLQSDLSNHVGNATPHASSDEKTLWNGIADEVEAARTSLTHGEFESINERLENIETLAAPDSHQSLSNRDTEATDLASSTHPADTIWDETGDQHVQDTLDAYDGRLDDLETDCAFKATIIESINDTSETEKISLDKIATIEVTDENVACGTTPAPLGGGTTSPLTQEEVNDTARRVWVPNLVKNGVWVYQGCYCTGRQAYDERGYNIDAYAQNSTLSAAANIPYGIPGWSVKKTSTYSNTTVQQHLTSGPTGTNSEFDGCYISINADVDGEHSGNDTNTAFVSDVISVTPNKVHTINFWYKYTSSSDKLTPQILIKQGGTTLITENLTTGTNTWTQVRKIFTPTQNSITIEFPAKAYFATATKHLYFIGPIGLWEGDYTNGELPRIWYNRENFSWPVKSDFGSSDTPPTVSFLPTYRSRYHAEIPVTSSMTGTLTVNIPPSVYVYNVKVSTDYALSIPFSWNAASAVNFRTPISSVDVYVGAPTTTGSVFADIDYWPVVE